MFEFIQVKPATIKATPKSLKRYIKAGQRIYLESLSNYTSLKDGTTYIFNDTGTKVKRIKNYI